MVVTKTALPKFPFQETGKESEVLFSISVPDGLTDGKIRLSTHVSAVFLLPPGRYILTNFLARDEIVEHLREVEEIKILSADTSEKISITCTVASEKDIDSIVPDFSYRRQKVTIFCLSPSLRTVMSNFFIIFS